MDLIISVSSAIESGPVTSISISADHSTVAGGHASGHIFTWEFAKPAKPFLHIPPIDRKRAPEADGHIFDVAILHVGFLGKRHTALVSADDRGMAFSHLATRGMSVIARSVKTTRILGRYPEAAAGSVRIKKPSSVLAFSPLPLGSNAEHVSDRMGLVAMLTPYLLVIVSTTPIAQTQYKTPRPKEIAAHSAMTAALAWFPSVKLKVPNAKTLETASKVKLVYCWSNVLTVLEVVEVESSASSGREGPPNLQFRPRSRWKAQEPIVAVQWLGRSVLIALTISQQAVILEDSSLRDTNSSDLIQKHIYHADLFSNHLNMLVEQLDEEDTSMHGVVADAFYMSFRAYKGRLFLLGFNELFFGTLSNWADRLLALMEDGNYIGAIELATTYYTGDADKVSVGLPDDDSSRHQKVHEKLLEMMSASLRYTFSKKDDEQFRIGLIPRLRELATACISACVSIGSLDFLFEDIYPCYQDADGENNFLEVLERFIMSDDIEIVPPTVIKDLVSHYTSKGHESQLEEMLCHLDPRAMDIDHITNLCMQHNLYDALIYVWNQALNDYTTLIDHLLGLFEQGASSKPGVSSAAKAQNLASVSKIFPYMSYILTSRVYPNGKNMDDLKNTLAQADIYHYLFSGSSFTVPNGGHTTRVSREKSDLSYRNLRRILYLDVSSFLSMLNEAFEDSFLNGGHEHLTRDDSVELTEAQKFGLSVNRQCVVRILLEIMTPPKYEPAQTVYLDMFIARNLPKFPQFILLPGHILHQVLVRLCQYPTDDVAEDCQLSIEYLLSVYQPPDLTSLVPLISSAGFYRVLRSIYRSEQQYAHFLQTCFEDNQENGDLVFDCIAECFRQSTGLSDEQRSEVQDIMEEYADQLVARDVRKTAKAVGTWVPDLHPAMLSALDQRSDERGEFEYLQQILDPEDEVDEEKGTLIRNTNRTLVERYVRLLCGYNPHHVSEYVDHLKTGDLRLDEVLPALEKSGAVDAAVVLLAREGKVREAVNRLTQHLKTLEAALLGLLDGASDSPDMINTAETAHDITASVQKFARVGIWLCQGQTKSFRKQKTEHRKPKADHEILSLDEILWLELIDTVVAVTKNVTEILEPVHQSPHSDDGHSDAPGEEPPFISSKVTAELRSVVQETFTALLAATSTPRANETQRTDVSFLKILRAFLSRASLSSPSLSNLRSVLSAIFSAYSHEDSLLSLANRLLDKDLFVHVREADAKRRRGWRPLGQVCEGCGRRAWGPGTGASVWAAWQQESQQGTERIQRKHAGHSIDRDIGPGRHGKGKAVQTDHGIESATPIGDIGASETGTNTSRINDGKDGEGGSEGMGALIVFSCRHLFHRSCLQKIQGADAAQREPVVGNWDFMCPLCH